MSEQKKPKPEVAKYLEATRYAATRGSCYACGHPSRPEIEADVAEFFRQKRAGKTAISFRRFFTEYVQPTYKYLSVYTGLKMHMERHSAPTIK